MTASTEELLSETTLFRGLDESFLRAVGALTEQRSLSYGDVLFKQGEEAESIFIVESGELEIVAQLPAQRQHPLARAKPGDLIGELALIAGGQRSATARAISDVSGLLLERRAFDGLRAAMYPEANVVMGRLTALVRKRLAQRYEFIRTALELDKSIKTNPPVVQGRSPAVSKNPLDMREIEYIARLPFFRGFSRGQLNELLSDVGRVEWSRGETFVVCGEQLDALYITIYGVIEGFLGAEHRLQRVRLAGPGAIAGHLGLLEDEISPISLRALERSVAVTLDSERFSELLGSDSLLGHTFVTELQEDLVGALADAERREAQVLAHHFYEA